MLAERFFVLNGDVLCDLDLTRADRAARAHRRAGDASPSIRSPIRPGTGSSTGSDDGEITEFLEKPEPHQIDTDEINAGAYLLERSVLDEIPPDRAVSIEREVFPRLVGDGLYGIRLEGYWIDIGTPERYLEANWDILEGRVETVTRVDDPAMVAADCEVSPSAELRAPCVVGPDSRIGSDALIERSVLLDELRRRGRRQGREQHPQRRRDRRRGCRARGRGDRRGRTGGR